MESARAKALNGLRILLVEDDFIVGDALAWSLSSCGPEDVELSPSVDASLQKITEKQFDVAVLDINLGGQSVEPVAAKLAEIETPFVFVTGYMDEEALPGLYESVPRLRKPVSPDELIRVLREIASEASGESASQ